MRLDVSEKAGTPGISLPVCSAGRPSSGSRAGTASHTSLSRIFVRFSILTPMTSETGSASGARDCADRRRGRPAFIRLAARERNHLNHRPNTDGGAKGTPHPRSASSTHPGSGPTPMAGTRDSFFAGRGTERTATRCPRLQIGDPESSRPVAASPSNQSSSAPRTTCGEHPPAGPRQLTHTCGYPGESKKRAAVNRRPAGSK